MEADFLDFPMLLNNILYITITIRARKRERRRRRRRRRRGNHHKNVYFARPARERGDFTKKKK